MTFDLKLRTKSKLDEDTFVELFNDREHWEFPEDAPNIAAYFNAWTEVYFHVRYDDGALMFVMNYCRSRGFGREAEHELAALAEDIPLVGFDAAAMFAQWDSDNRNMYKRAVADGAKLQTYEGDLERIWEWNYTRDAIAEENGDHYTPPAIRFGIADGRVQTFAIYLCDENMLVPRTDLVGIGKGDQLVIVPWSSFEEALPPRGIIDDPVPYWAELSIQAERKLAKFLKRGHPSVAFERIEFGDVHARDDVTTADVE